MPLIGKALKPIVIPRYVKFSSPNSFKLYVIGNKKKWDGTIEYSTDGQTWKEWGGWIAYLASISSAQVGDHHQILVRGYNNTIITGEDAATDDGAWHILDGANVSVSGPISSLIDYRHIPTSIGAYAYKNLFGWKSPGDTVIVDASKLIIDGPISSNCCFGMFSRNKGLIEGPKFPSLTLADHCYTSAFYQCEALAVLPRLYATNLPLGCYGSLFNGCTSIKVYENPTVYVASGNTASEINLTPYRIPFEGTGIDQGSGTEETAFNYIFAGTGGNFHPDGVGAEVNVTYYVNNQIADD